MSIEDLKVQIKSYPISQIVGNYIPLVRKGRNQSALCPFHADSNPSLSVNDDKGLFKCFVCNVGGDGIAFVEKYKNLGFRESLAECAKILGLDSSELDKKTHKDPKYELAAKTMDAAMKVYRKYAQEVHPEEFTAFLKTRGLSDELAQNFGLGFAPPQQIFINYLKSLPTEWREPSLKMAKELGLIGDSSSGREYEHFNERIIFPIWDLQGQVVGLGSRATKENQKGKYINSRDSFFFHKKNLLYGYHLARPAMREKNRVLLVEGYMDVISLHRFGINESMAVMGTSPPSEKNLRLLKSQAKEIILGLDADPSGEAAMERFLPIFLNEGILPRVLSYTPHKDADEFLRVEGSFELQKRIDGAPLLVDELIEKIIQASILKNSLEHKVLGLEKVFALVSPLKDDVRALERIHTAANRLEMASSREALEKSYMAFLKGIKTSISSSYQLRAKETIIHDAPISNDENIDTVELAAQSPLNELEIKMAPQFVPVTKSARILLREVLRQPDLAERPEMAELLDFIGHDEIRRVFGQMKKLLWEVAPDALPSMLLNSLAEETTSKEVRELVGSFAFEGPLRPLDDKAKAKLLQDLNLRVREESLVEKRNKLTSLSLPDEKMPEDLSVSFDSLLTEISKLDKEINQLRRSRKPLSL